MPVIGVDGPLDVSIGQAYVRIELRRVQHLLFWHLDRPLPPGSPLRSQPCTSAYEIFGRRRVPPHFLFARLCCRRRRARACPANSLLGASLFRLTSLSWSAAGHFPSHASFGRSPFLTASQ